MAPRNLLDDLPPDHLPPDHLPPNGAREVFEDVLANDAFRVERIVSLGQATPDGPWCDQAWSEWVLVLQGAAELRLEDEPQPRRLAPGDHLLLPAHCRHRVEWTDPQQPTIWLAIHFVNVGHSRSE